MALPSMMSRPFTRKRYPLVTDHGTATVDYSAPGIAAIFYGSLQPGTGTVDMINRNGAEVVYTIFARPDADVNHLDLVTTARGTFYVNGEPESWETGIMDHLVIHLSRWVG